MDVLSRLLASDSQPSSAQEPQFLGNLSSEEFQRFLTGGETRHLEAGSILITEGAQDTALDIILQGEVEVLVPTEKGFLQVAVLGPGSVIGELAFLDNLPRSARVVAKTPCSALRITRESFQGFALREPQIALVFIWGLSKTVAFRLRRVQRFDAAEAARDQERKALAELLHDETMADLGSMAVELGFMKRTAAKTSPELGAALDEFRARLRSADRRLREIVQGIFPPSLTLRGLPSAVNTLLNDLSSRPIASPHPLEMELRTTGFGKDRLPESTEIGVDRVIQQCVANVIKHSQAKLLKVDLTWGESELTFAVADNGMGFDPASPRESPATGHFGLVNLWDRMEALMGSLKIESQPGAGTTLTGRVPLISDSPRPRDSQISRFIMSNEEPVPSGS